jgi:hopanoid biosynthesis associated protein HpnK
VGAPRLIVTADDFGAAIAVNEAVEIAHREGILTAASLMVTGDAIEDAVARARRLPELGVGLHVVLVEGRPVLPPEQVPALVGSDGRFHDDMVKTALRIAFDPAARRQMRAEVAAQFARFAATGLPLDHANAHKHFHLHPMIAGAMIAAGRPHGLHAIRAPIEPQAGLALALWARLLAAGWRRAGLLVNDHTFGLAATGAFDTATMGAALAALRPGLTELYTHPATNDDWFGAAPGYRYRDELAALIDPQLRATPAERGPFARFAALAA